MRRIWSLAATAFLPLVASGGSVYAWTKFHSPVAIPTQARPLSSPGTLGPLGTGLSASHGLSTTHGGIGLAAAGACAVAVVGLLLPGRLRLAATSLIALAGLAVAANGLTGFLSAAHIQHGWTDAINAVHGLSKGGVSSAARDVSGKITRNSLAPSGGATVAGGASFLGGVRGFRTTLRSLRYTSRQLSFGPQALRM